MIGWIIGGVVVIALVLFLKKAKFIPGCSASRMSPDDTFEAVFGTRTEKKQGALPQTFYEVSVSMVIPVSETSFGLLELFKSSVPQSSAMHDLPTKKTDEIIRWDTDSAKVTFFVSAQPILVNVKELASEPETKKRIELFRQNTSGR
jgi:hypothetical protein